MVVYGSEVLVVWRELLITIDGLARIGWRSMIVWFVLLI